MRRARQNQSNDASPPVSDGDELAVSVHRDDNTTQYTFFPADVDEDALTTHWLTADDAAVVDLEAWR